MFLYITWISPKMSPETHLKHTWIQVTFRWDFFVFFRLIRLPRWLPHSNQGAHMPNTTAQSHMAGHTVSHCSLQWWLASSWPWPGVWPGHTVSLASHSIWCTSCEPTTPPFIRAVEQTTCTKTLGALGSQQGLGGGECLYIVATHTCHTLVCMLVAQVMSLRCTTQHSTLCHCVLHLA